MFRVRRKASWQADEAERRRSADQSFLLLEERGKMIISQEEIEAEPMSAEEASATSSSIEAAALRPSLEERIEYNPLKVKLLARSQAIAANCRQRAHTAFLLLEDMAPVARTRSRGRSASPSAAWRCIPSPLLADGDRQSLGDSAWITQADEFRSRGRSSCRGGTRQKILDMLPIWREEAAEDLRGRELLED